MLCVRCRVSETHGHTCTQLLPTTLDDLGTSGTGPILYNIGECIYAYYTQKEVDNHDEAYVKNYRLIR
jgi:hypothetical protein